MKRRPRRLPALLLGLACASAAGAAAASRAPFPDLGSLDSKPRRDVLAAAGLYESAERMLRDSVSDGDSTARGPLARLLLVTERAAEAESLLGSWGGPESLGEDSALFTVARIHEAAGHSEQALDAYLASATREPLLADHAAFRAGGVLEALDRPDDAVTQFAAASEAARTRRLGALAAFRAAGIAAARGNPARARELLDRVPPRSVIARADRDDLEATLARADGDSAAESRALWSLVDAAPASDAALRATERLAALAPPTTDERIAFARVALAGRRPGVAERQLDAALARLKEAPDPVREGKVRLLRGRARMARQEYSAARKEFARLPEGARAEDRDSAALEAARCLWRLEQIDACLVEYDAIACGQAADSIRATATFEAAREAKDDGRDADAARRFAEFQRTWPTHDSADDALWFGARCLSADGNPSAALEALVTLRRVYPSSERREEAAYWTALLHRDANEPEAACHDLAVLQDEFPDSYWSQRAPVLGAALGCRRAPTPPPAERDASDWVRSDLRALAPPDAARLAALTASEPFRRARELAAVGLREDAEAEFTGMRSTADADAGQLLLLAEAAWSIGLPREGMRAAFVLKRRADADILSGGMPPSVARLLYPVAHLDSVRRWAAENDLDPFFVYAVMREESWLDPGAVSGAGARGLLQIMPATGYDLALRAGLRPFRADDLFDPDVNIRLGARYLRELLDGLEDQPTIALAAYNAGKGNATRWRREEGGAFDPDRYVAQITYRETYGYVQKVLRTYAIYRALWGDIVAKLPAPGNRSHAR